MQSKKGRAPTHSAYHAPQRPCTSSSDAYHWSAQGLLRCVTMLQCMKAASVQEAAAVATLAFMARGEQPGDAQPTLADGVLMSVSAGPLATAEYLAAVDLAHAAAVCVASFARASLERSFEVLA
jgi:hypothetical protein